MCVANEVLHGHSVNYLVVAGLGPENALESIAVENAWKITINNRHDSRKPKSFGLCRVKPVEAY